MFEGLATIMRGRPAHRNPNQQQFDGIAELHLLGMTGETWSSVNGVFAANPRDTVNGVPPFLLSLEGEKIRNAQSLLRMQENLTSIKREVSELESRGLSLRQEVTSRRQQVASVVIEVK